MNIVFTFLLISSIAMSMLTCPDITYSSMLKGAMRGIELTVTLCTIYAICMSILDIVARANVDKAMYRVCAPLSRWLFPGEDMKTHSLITSNIIMNMLGIGSGATPLGIEAIERMQKGSTRATQNSVLFAVINATSIQLIPTTIVGMRASHGAVNPSDIILPSLVSTTVATLVGIILVKALVSHE